MNKNEGVNHWKDSWKFFDDGCPFCQSKNFLGGPHDGFSVNFKCVKCEATFNNMGSFGVYLLSGPKNNQAVSA